MFERSIFRIFGFPVRVDSSWLLIAGLVTWSLATGLFPARYPGLATSAYWSMGILGAIGLFLPHVRFFPLVQEAINKRTESRINNMGGLSSDIVNVAAARAGVRDE